MIYMLGERPLARTTGHRSVPTKAYGGRMAARRQVAEYSEHLESLGVGKGTGFQRSPLRSPLLTRYTSLAGHPAGRRARLNVVPERGPGVRRRTGECVRARRHRLVGVSATPGGSTQRGSTHQSRGPAMAGLYSEWPRSINPWLMVA